nr:SNF2 helicase associated domain-containing protein [Bacillus sp. T3]
MNIRLNRKIIQDRCGTVSFKRGDSFCRENKVKFLLYNQTACEAVVQGKEDFTVKIVRKADGDFLASCSCPKLASYQKDCQHIAAVLLSLYENQQQGTTPQIAYNIQTVQDNEVIADDIVQLFTARPQRGSARQLHFENRRMVDVSFLYKPIKLENDINMLGIEMKIGSVKVKNIRYFLKMVGAGKGYDLSPTMQYDPSVHCFQIENDAVIQQLTRLIEDEMTISNMNQSTMNDEIDQAVLAIPPAAWERLLPFLSKIPKIALEYQDALYEGIQIEHGPLPLQFDLDEGSDSTYVMKIDGLQQLLILESYLAVLAKGKFYKVNQDDCQRLTYFQQLLAGSRTKQIRIHQQQQSFFLEKVIPGLKKLGEVRFSGEVIEKLDHPPLIAKLYLDRVKNRLLAGLEFHYEKVIINPLEPQNSSSQHVFIRDSAKETQILELMEDSDFAKTEGGYYLHNEELEYQFLYHIVPKLEKIVKIYVTTAVRNRIFNGHAQPKIRVRVRKERTNWLEFKFEFDGVHEKHIREVLSALEEKRKYYRVPSGALMSLETREFEAVKKFLNTLPEQKEDIDSTLNVPIIRGLRLLDTIEDSNVFLAENSFQQFLEELLHPEKLAVEVPKSLEPILRDYQKLGYKWLKTLASYGFGGILGDSMGLGKTLQSISYIASEVAAIRERKQPVLIICPASLTYNWLNEIRKFSPELAAIVIDGSKDQREKQQSDLMNYDVVIISYPLLRRDIKWFEQQQFHTVFFDEAQAFKNPVTQTARAVKRVQANHRFALTGTPIENSIEELWAIYHVVFPELFLGLKEYSKLTNKGISRKIRPFLLRRSKEDVLEELPNKIETLEVVELFPDQKKLYGAYLAKLREDTLKHLDKDTLQKNRIKILAGLTETSATLLSSSIVCRRI